MTAEVQAAMCARWRSEKLGLSRPDLVRVQHIDGVTLALLANAYESGFSTCWAVGSRLLLEEFQRAWDVSGGTINRRLGDAFRIASTGFCQKAGPLVGDMDFPDGEYAGGTLLVAAISGPGVEVAWIGPARAVLAREGKVVAQTRPHTMLEQFRDACGDAPLPDDAAFLGVVTRSIGSSRDPDDAVPERMSFRMAPGDTLVLAAGGFSERPAVAAKTLATAARAANVDAAASAVASAVYANGDPAFAASATLRLR